MDLDRIEKHIILRAPRSRVWQAISTASEFGAWFGVKIDGAFSAGARVSGRITIPKYEHLTLEIVIDQIVPERLFSYRWHPYAIDPAVDYSSEPMTLVEFRLEDVAEGTKLTVIETGFAAIPAARRETAFRMNEGGWAQQLVNIENYVSTKVAP